MRTIAFVITLLSFCAFAQPIPPPVIYPITVARGGTGGVNADTARSNLGAVGLSDTETLTNKTLGTGTAIDLGSDATGDIYYRNSGGDLARLPVGSNGEVLTLSSGLPSWAAGGGADVSGLGGLYGDGSAGDLSTSSGVTSITDNQYISYNDLTISGSATVASNGVVLYVRDELDISSAPENSVHANGNNATGGSAGSAFSNADRSTPHVPASTPGGESSNTNGSQAGATAAMNIVITSNESSYGNSGSGGAGGASSPRSGGSVRAVGTALSVAIQVPPLHPDNAIEWSRYIGSSSAGLLSFYGGAVNKGATGGGGGAGNGSAPGTQGGGGGSTAGPLVIYARRIIVSASTPACVLSARGGVGGNSANASNADSAAGGGGGGGHGGLLIVVTDSITATDATTSVADALCADSGAGGDAGTSNGTATDASGGYAGRSGRVILYVRGTGQTYYASASAGTAPTGRTGGGATQSRVALPVD